MTFVRHGFIITIKKNRERERIKSHKIQISIKNPQSISRTLSSITIKKNEERKRETRKTLKVE